MKLTNARKTVATLAGTALLTTLGAGAFAETGNPFTLNELDGGYMLAAKSDAEGKCGEGKCGEDKDSAEGKCGEGKCGGTA